MCAFYFPFVEFTPVIRQIQAKITVRSKDPLLNLPQLDFFLYQNPPEKKKEMAVVWRIYYLSGLMFFLVLVILTCAEPVRVPLSSDVCTLNSVKDFIFASPNNVCSVRGGVQLPHSRGVIEGGEVSLQKALYMVYTNQEDYVALLFYSSWCPFSRSLRPTFSVLSSIYSSIQHFAIEESAVRPSTLSKYGVHGFPTLILLNSTMRVPYQGTRAMDSLISFYGVITGIETAAADEVHLDKIGCALYNEKHKTNLETCPFPWAKSPKNLFQQETYLTLATIFVILRLLYLTFPTLQRYTRLSWRRSSINFSLSSLWEHPMAHLNRVAQLFNTLKEPC